MRSMATPLASALRPAAAIANGSMSATITDAAPIRARRDRNNARAGPEVEHPGGHATVSGWSSTCRASAAPPAHRCAQ